MDQVWATVIAALGSAAIAGVIAMISAVITYRAAGRQLQAHIAESTQNRKHQLYLDVRKKQQEALETLWVLLFAVERNVHLSETEADLYVRSIMWLPDKVRESSLTMLKKHGSVFIGSETGEVPGDVVTGLRRAVLNHATSLKLA